jgi:hypothetical protein
MTIDAGLGPDIKEVYVEEGSSIQIVNRSPVVSEKILYELNAQATKPFIREHHLDCFFPYDTVIETGDVVFITESNRYYIVMNKTPELFEDNVVEYSGVLYLCNLPTTAHIVRPVEIRDKSMSSSSGYDMITGWTVIANAPVYGLMSDRIFGSAIENGIIVGQDELWRIDLYIPKWYDIKPLDRLIVSSTEYYKVETVESYNYPGCVMALLVEDTRGETTIIGDEVYDD